MANYSTTCRCPGDHFDPCYCPEKPASDRAAIADLFATCDNYDLDDDGGAYLRLPKPIECPECGAENQTFGDRGNPWEGSIYECSDCGIEIGRQYPKGAK